MSDDIDALLGRMSLTEKVGQLNLLSATADSTGAGAGAGDIESRIGRGEIGMLAGGVPVARLAALQKIAIEQSPHKIPLIYTLDVIHGHRTIFPIPLALACSWDPELVRRVSRVAAVEATACGITLNWAPMLDVSRDARWGRCAESAGEDPLLGALYARAMVQGFQGDDVAQTDALLATAKHFAGYGFAEGGRDYNLADISPYRMHNVVLPSFKAAVETGVGAVMVAFHDLAGIPCTAHRDLLRGLLRERWGFDGLIVSDYTGIMELVNHGVAADEKEAALLAFSAGVDVDMASEHYSRHLPALVAEGRLAERDIDAACRRVLRAKQKLRLFEQPYRGLDAARQKAVILAPEHRQLARAAAARSCVLLQNNGVLPFQRAGTIALIGPLADSRPNMQGTWAVAAQAEDSVTVLDGLRAAAGDRCQIVHAKGANIVDDANVAARLNVFGEIATIDAHAPDELIAEAVHLARRADVVVACVGEAREHTGEASTRSKLGLPGSQQRLLRALHQAGKPLVLVTFSGRPLALEWEAAHAGAILHAWFGGSETGNAIADLLFGDANPSGKLTMSFPRNAGQCPIYYAEPPTGRPIDKLGIDAAGDSEARADGRHVFRKFTTACRIDGPHTPLYPFGHGLGYSAFAYGELRLDKTALRGASDALTASVTVRNTGGRAGEEIVQLYIADPVASRSRPVRELKGFQKIMLQAGEARRVSFRITAAELGFFRAERLSEPELVCEPGRFLVQIGASSQSLATAEFEWQP